MLLLKENRKFSYKYWIIAVKMSVGRGNIKCAKRDLFAREIYATVSSRTFQCTIRNKFICERLFCFVYIGFVRMFLDCPIIF